MKTFPIDNLKPNPNNIRKEFDEEFLGYLSKSISRFGVVNPILALKDGTIVAGHQRWLAAKKAGKKSLQVGRELIFLEGSLVRGSKGLREDLDTINAIENMLRRNLTVFEEAEGLLRLIKEYCGIEDPEDAFKKLRSAGTYVGSGKKLPDTHQKLVDVAESLGLGISRAFMLLSLHGLEPKTHAYAEKHLGSGVDRFGLGRLYQISRLPKEDQLRMARASLQHRISEAAISQVYHQWEMGIRDSNFQLIRTKDMKRKTDRMYAQAVIERRERVISKLVKTELPNFSMSAFIADLRMLKIQSASVRMVLSQTDAETRMRLAAAIDEAAGLLLELQAELKPKKVIG